MEERKLFGSEELMTSFINKHLEKIEVIESEWSIRYVEKTSPKEWKKYVSDDRSFKNDLIQLEPPLDTNILITLALYSQYQDESEAAIRRLLFEESYSGKEYRMELLYEIKKYAEPPLKDIDKQRVIRLITQSNLLSSNNKKNIIGKPYQEVQKDYEVYKKVATEALDILSALKQ